ncbi:hypothetical protein [Rhizosaccharibacter radicis]|uniref:XRE family transcriptional regulator n=1 Tax=Rhizosaccharibacter radicis TaxID=2782605 RepID=A0ABT1VW31_9PROT|nr:hypothetical protein [Acetobacteraceae bacterium KSS12]
MNYRKQLIELAERFAAARKLSEARIANLAGRDGRFFTRMREGKGCKVDTMLSTIQFFSNHWPTDAVWPAEIKRPAPSESAA